jgi:hypothetical protein
VARIPTSAADACVINALAALLVDGLLHPDVAADLRGVVAEALPRVSRDNPDMTALSIAASKLLAGGGSDGRDARLTIGVLLQTILRARAYEAWGRLQNDEGKNVERDRKNPFRGQ